MSISESLKPVNMLFYTVKGDFAAVIKHFDVGD